MSDRKYRQRGYQDEPRAKEPPREKRPPEPKAPGRPLQDAAGPRTPNLMAAHEVFKCARCGHRLSSDVVPDARCARCDVAVHSCINCVSFDTSARWECAQRTLPSRVSPKDERNLCELFAPRATIERQTGTPVATTTNSARKAFDDLFK